MKKNEKGRELSDIDKIKNFLVKLGFVCNSYPSAHQLIYSKDGETILIKNNKQEKRLN